MSAGNARRQAYLSKVERLLSTYEKILVIDVDNIRSIQIANLRRLLRGKAEVLFGKNTLIRRVITHMENEGLQQLLSQLKLNVALVLTNGEYKPIVEAFAKTRRDAKAKAGMIAPCDVILQPMQTDMGPDQSGFCASMGLNTKINRGKIEITTATELIKAGSVVSPSHATLLQKLGINPFYYQISVKKVYDNGQLFDPDILTVDEEVMTAKWNAGLSHFVSAALGLHYPCLPAIPHIFADTAKSLVGVGVELDVNIPLVQTVKQILADPSKFAAPAASAPAAAAAPVEEKKEEEEEEEVIGTGGLFGGDSSSDDDSDSDSD